MATLTTSYKLLGSVKTSTYSQLRLYGKYNSQSTDNNTSSVSLQLRLYGNGGSGSFSSGTAKISGTSYSLGNTSYSKNAEKTLCTKTYTATHSSDGTYTASISYSITSTGTVSGSSSVSITLPQIKRTSVLGNISDFTFGNSIPITYTEYVSSYTANLNVIIGSTTVKTVNNISSGTSISFTSGELNTIYGLVPNATTTSVTFQLVTMNGSTQIGTNSKSATGTIPSSVKPTISSVVLEDSLGYRQQIGNYVQSKSKIHGTISSSGGTGSGISSIETQINGETIYGNNFYTKELATSGTNSYTVRVTDTRGRSATYTGSYTVQAYTPIAISFNVYRSNSSGNQDDNGNYICINVNASIDSLNNENSKEFKIEYRQGGGSWTTLTTYNTSYNYVLTNSVYSGFSSSYPFDVRLTVTDTFGSEYAQIWIPTAKTVLDFYHDGTGVAIGKVADTPNKFDVAYDMQVNGSIVTSGNVSSGGKTSSTSGKGVMLDGSGGIEISHSSTPYIDFHYANSSGDFTSRLFEAGSGILVASGALLNRSNVLYGYKTYSTSTITTTGAYNVLKTETITFHGGRVLAIGFTNGLSVVKGNGGLFVGIDGTNSQLFTTDTQVGGAQVGFSLLGTPSAGSHTITMGVYANGGTTATISAYKTYGFLFLEI